MIKMWFIGNVVFDPRMGTTASGKQVCNFVNGICGYDIQCMEAARINDL